MRAYLDSAPREKLRANSARNAERRCEAAREMSAAASVLEAAVFNFGGEVGVSGARQVAQLVIVL